MSNGRRGLTGLHTEEHRRLTTALAQARVDAGVTQYELADRLGVDQTYVSKYEGGRRRLDVVEFMRIVAALGVDYREIIAAMRMPEASDA
ncbi:restriction-modification system control element Bcll family protein [Brevundimonas diminuta 470-4]|nr:restriction-modification system control element Bcll family protein [Brevundimonas diminuta 470-4]